MNVTRGGVVRLRRAPPASLTRSVAGGYLAAVVVVWHCVITTQAATRTTWAATNALTARTALVAVPPKALLVEPDDGSRTLVKAIDRAQRDIFVECYLITDRTLAHALERAAAQGVAVYVMLEPRPFGLGLQPTRMATELQAAGIRFRWTPPRFALTHAKYLIIDDVSAWISTANFSRAAFHSNREFLVNLTQPAIVRRLSNLFRWDWDRLGSRGMAPPLVVAPDNARTLFGALIGGARQSVSLYAEEIQDPAFERLLLAAARRHVSVRVILAWGQTPLAARLLVGGGVAVREFRKLYVHAKVVQVDDRLAFIGSENPSTQSLDQNREVGVLINGATLKRIGATFDHDWEQGVPIHR